MSDDKKIHKLFRIKYSLDGQILVGTISRNGKIGFVTETFHRHQGAERAIKTLLKQVYEAITLIDGDWSRINELIDDRTGEPGGSGTIRRRSKNS